MRNQTSKTDGAVIKRGKTLFSFALAMTLPLLAINDLLAKRTASNAGNEMATVNCCRMDRMSVAEAPARKADQGRHSDTGLENRDCCVAKQVGAHVPPNGIGAENQESQAAPTIVQSQLVKGLIILLIKGEGRFALGRNRFCLEFRSSRPDQIAEPGDVYTGFTMAIGRVKALRAVAYVTRADTGRYCGEVTLGMSGTWSMEVKYDGPAGKGKTVFDVPVS